VPPGSVTVAYSNQLMEHLHPDDAREQLRNIFEALAPGGRYVCLTPNRLNGPHDVSRHFDETATGFHLKEYTIGELRTLFKQAGFSTVDLYLGGKGFYRGFPLCLPPLRRGLSNLPISLRKAIARSLPVRALLFGRLVGTK